MATRAGHTPREGCVESYGVAWCFCRGKNVSSCLAFWTCLLVQPVTSHFCARYSSFRPLVHLPWVNAPPCQLSGRVTWSHSHYVWPVCTSEKRYSECPFLLQTFSLSLFLLLLVLLLLAYLFHWIVRFLELHFAKCTSAVLQHRSGLWLLYITC